ncbi:MAG: hypothetical protein BEN19_03015 [Epulopiscium sp. Nuni2H_MBin003]|nr:MAG: hypothetical protein BEN19_03015 [Epulopiscium sp. Nuni2H_MBin003]
MSSKKRLLILFIVAALLAVPSNIIIATTGNKVAGIMVAVVLFILFTSFMSYRNRFYVYANKANEAFSKKEHDKAFELYQQALDVKHCPDSIRIAFAYRLLYTHNIKQATDLIDSIDETKLNKESRYYYNLTQAGLFFQDNELDKCITICQDLYEKSPTEVVAEVLGRALNVSEQYDKALEFSSGAIILYANNAIIKDNLATSYFYSYEDVKARKIYKELIDARVNFPEPYYYYARIAYEDNRFKTAIKHLQLALQKDESFMSNLTYAAIQKLLDEITQQAAPNDYTDDTPIEEISDAPIEEISDAPIEEIADAPVAEIADAPVADTNETPVIDSIDK